MMRPAATAPAAVPAPWIVVPNPANQPHKRGLLRRRDRFPQRDARGYPIPLPLDGKTREEYEAEEAEREQGRTLFRLRRHLYPWNTAAGLAAAACGPWIATATGADPFWTTATTSTVAFGAAATAYAAVRSQIPRRWRGRLAAAGLYGAGWLTCAAATGPSWSLAAALAAGTVGFGARWWRSLRYPYPDGPPVHVEEEPEVDESIPALWWRNVGGTDGALPGSWLVDGEQTKHGERYIIRLKPGKHYFRSVVSALPRIASGLLVEPEDIVVDKAGPAKARLQVVTDSPLAANAKLEHPRWHDGIIDIGPYADGEGEAPWRIYTREDDGGSVHSGIIIGTTGTGKSRVAENLMISAMSSGLVVPWFIDPQGGVSSPAMQDHADWYTGLSGAGAMLEAVEGVVRFRAVESAARGWTGFTPTPQRPILLVFIDECHEIFTTAKQGKRWAEILRKCRKLGVGFVLMSQYSGLETFGNSEPLRAQAMTGNVLAMYAPSRTNGMLMPGLEVDPLDLPNVPGYGYTAAIATARLAPMRNRRPVDARAQMAAQPHLTLDPVAAKGAGDAYAKRLQTPEQRRAAAEQDLADLMEGRATITLTSRADEELEEEVVDGLVVPALPKLPADVDHPKAKAASKPTLTAVPNTCRDAVVAALRNGPQRTKELRSVTGYSESQVRNTLNELVAAGRVEKTGHGIYQLATPRPRMESTP